MHVFTENKGKYLLDITSYLELCGTSSKPEAKGNINEPVHNKIYNNICVTSKDSDQPVHPPSMPTVLVWLSFDSLEATEGTCIQQRFWSDCADGQADLSLRWLHKFIVGFVMHWLW